MSGHRHDFRKPAGNRAGLPQTNLPTPNVADAIIIETLPGINVRTYEPLLKGTPHPLNPLAKLVFEVQQPGNNNEVSVKRVYATDRAGQETYNAARKFVANSADHPIYIRSYVLPRPVTPASRNNPLTSLVGITLTNGGSGYTAGAPIVTFTGGGGTGATAEVEMQDGVVKAIWLTDGGTGYSTAPTVTFNASGDDPNVTVETTDRGVASIAVSDGGYGYDPGSPPDVILTGGGGTGATAIVSAISGGAILSVTVTNAGTGYTSPPDVSFSAGPAIAGAILDTYSITGITVNFGGTGFTTAPTVSIADSEGGGSGATATATISQGAVVTVSVTNGGSGFSGDAIVTFTGGRPGEGAPGGGAAATALIQPQGAVLTDEEITPAEGELASLYEHVTRVYTTQPGPIIHERSSYKGVMIMDRTRQNVVPGTLPGAVSGTTLEDTVRQLSTTEAEQLKSVLLKADGTAASGFPIYTTARTDEKTGVVIYTDHFITDANYTLPSVYVGGTAALIAANYPDWKQPNATPGTGYSPDSYTPKRYVIDARKSAVSDQSSQVLVQVDYCRIPPSRMEKVKLSYTFPAIFVFNDTPYFLPNDYGGQYRPPWPIGEDEVGGFRRIAHRSDRWTAMAYFTYTLGPRGTLPKIYNVITPGTASKFFQIPEHCVHNGFTISETLTDGSTQVVENIPPSTPSYYDSNDILCADAQENRWNGEIYEQTVILISEDRPLSAFPSPENQSSTVLYEVTAPFRITPSVSFTAGLQGREVLVYTTGAGSESVDLQLFARSKVGDPPVSLAESITATPTPAATSNGFVALKEVLLAAPTATDSVIIQEPTLPSSASIEVTGTPADGDLLTIGLTAGDVRTYQFRTALTSDAVESVAVTAAGSGYTSGSVTVSFSGGSGSGAAATATVSGGAITAITVTNPGTGYVSAPSVTISASGSGATGTAHLTTNTVSSVTVGSGGSGYVVAPTVSFTDGGTTATGTVTTSGGAVTAVTVTNAGSGYNGTSNITLQPSGPGGTGATISVTVDGSGSVTGSPTVVTGGSGWSNGQGVLFIGGKGSGASYTATVSGGAVTGFVQVSAGSGYLVAPNVVITPPGSGATATATLGQANQILISSDTRQMATRIAQALSGTSLGAHVGTGTTAHGDLEAEVDAALKNAVIFTSTDPLSAPDSSSWTFTLSSGSWASTTGFFAGEDGQIIATIPAGTPYAHQAVSLTGNAVLFDEQNDNDSRAVANLPAGVVVYTDWVAFPAGVALTLRYSVAGAPAVRFAYQTSTDGTVPAPVNVSVGVTNGSKIISGSLSAYVGCKIVIPGDTIENELVNSTTLLRSYRGSTGTKTASVTNLPATLLPSAANGHPQTKVVSPSGAFIRLKITQTQTPYKYRAAQAEVGYSINQTT